jgi:hypothetical protein
VSAAFNLVGFQLSRFRRKPRAEVRVSSEETPMCVLPWVFETDSNLAGVKQTMARVGDAAVAIFLLYRFPSLIILLFQGEVDD